MTASINICLGTEAASKQAKVCPKQLVHTRCREELWMALSECPSEFYMWIPNIQEHFKDFSVVNSSANRLLWIF